MRRVGKAGAEERDKDEYGDFFPRKPGRRLLKLRDRRKWPLGG